MTDDEIMALASNHADIEQDRRGRKDISMDDIGLLAFARAVEREAMERAARIVTRDVAWQTSAQPGSYYRGYDAGKIDGAAAIRAEAGK